MGLIKAPKVTVSIDFNLSRISSTNMRQGEVLAEPEASSKRKMSLNNIQSLITFRRLRDKDSHLKIMPTCMLILAKIMVTWEEEQVMLSRKEILLLKACL